MIVFIDDRREAYLPGTTPSELVFRHTSQAITSHAEMRRPSYRWGPN